MLGWGEIIGYLFKLVGLILEAKAKGTLTQEKLDAAVSNLQYLPPQKEG